jgi:4'-phosphopantetheinyl transferase
MKPYFSIQPKTIHLWRIVLSDLFPQLAELTALLSQDEFERAARFKFEIHRQRYITTRGILRRVLSFYTKMPAAALQFSYGKRGKPFLAECDVKFNVSHSDNLAVFAITIEGDVGVDIEKIEMDAKENIAKRFFSAKEFAHLQALPQNKKITAFYHIWAKKEALIKALGEGLYAPLETFSVGVSDDIETVGVKRDATLVSYAIQSFFVHSDYQAAYATSEFITHREYWEWLPSGPSHRGIGFMP